MNKTDSTNSENDNLNQIKPTYNQINIIKKSLKEVKDKSTALINMSDIEKINYYQNLSLKYSKLYRQALNYYNQLLINQKNKINSQITSFCEAKILTKKNVFLDNIKMKKYKEEFERITTIYKSKSFSKSFIDKVREQFYKQAHDYISENKKISAKNH